MLINTFYYLILFMNNIKITSDLRWYIKILNMIYKIRNCIKGWKIYVKI